jgi:hypothetical protein
VWCPSERPPRLVSAYAVEWAEPGEAPDTIPASVTADFLSSDTRSAAREKAGRARTTRTAKRAETKEMVTRLTARHRRPKNQSESTEHGETDDEEAAAHPIPAPVASRIRAIAGRSAASCPTSVIIIIAARSVAVA